MTRHSLLTHAPLPYYSNANAGTEEEKRWQGIVRAIKNGRNLVHTPTGEQFSATKFFVEAYKVNGPKERVFVSAERTAVPIPSSIHLGPRAREQWPCLDICARFAERGLVHDGRPILTRRTAIVQSHRVPPDQRPPVAEIIESLAVDASLLAGVQAITLIDDVVTSGSNAIGALVALRRAGFRGDVVLFAAGHTANSGTKGDFFGESVWLEGKKPRAFRPPPEPGWFDNIARRRA